MAPRPMSKTCREGARKEITCPILHAMVDRELNNSKLAAKTRIPRSTLYGALKDPCGSKLETVLRIAAAAGLDEVRISTKNFRV